MMLNKFIEFPQMYRDIHTQKFLDLYPFLLLSFVNVLLHILQLLILVYFEV